MIGKNANSAFVGTGLEGLLDELGATTLVLCGVLTPNSVEATARHAGNLGYQVFVVADACWAVDKIDLRGKRWPAEDVHALSLAHLEGEYATVVDAATTLRAAAAPRRASGARARPDQPRLCTAANSAKQTQAHESSCK